MPNYFSPVEHLHDPYLMKDMDKAVARIETAIENQERILVFEIMIDGTTAALSLLKKSFILKYTYIPDRYDEGYGVSFKGIDFAEDNGYFNHSSRLWY
jgi:single-stranded-DNA-specific exonuclease